MKKILIASAAGLTMGLSMGAFADDNWAYGDRGGNAANDNSTAVSVHDTLNNNSIGNETLTIGDIGVVTSTSVLEGSVSGNSVGTLGLIAEQSYSNATGIDHGAFANASGITQVSQNTGIQGLTQQGVSVQSNVSLGGK